MSDGNADTSAQDESARLALLEQRLDEVQVQARAQVMRAELKAEALRAGMVDLDGLKLIDTTDLKLNERGEIDGVAAVMRDLRRQKPWLFGAGSSSSTAAAPPAQPPRPKLATEMSEAEWRAARADLLRRR